jgi:hypothetical protein
MTVAALRAGALPGLLNQSSAQVIDGCLKFQNDLSTYLTRTPGSAGNRSVYTGSVWVKRTEFAPENNSNSNAFNYSIFTAGTNSANNSDQIKFYKNVNGYQNCIEYSAYDGAYHYLLYTDARFRDPNAWYNIVWNYDGTRANLFVNGERVTSYDTETQNGGSDGHFNNNVEHVIGHTPDQNNSSQFDGYMSQFNWIDGQALGPGYFGFTDPLTGTWRPRKFTAEGTTVNNGTTWSNFSSDPDNVIHSGDATELFNGNLSSGGVTLHDTTTASNEWFIALSGVSIPCKHSVSFWSQNGAGTATMRINGEDNLKVEATSTAFNWYTLNFNGTINKIELAYLDGGSSNTFFGLKVDGVILRDGVTQNLAYGTNGFYLPMDGNSPIGQDKSGNGNDWTPVNFGGSNTLEKATGALPILNTVNGGNTATVGVRTDAYASNLVLALPLVGGKEDVVASINSAQTNVTVTNNGSVPFQTTQSNFYGGSAFFEDSSSDNLTFTNFGSRFEFTGDYTIEAWIYPTDSGAADGSIFVENSGSDYFGFNFDPGTQFNIYNNSSSASWSPSTNLPPANKWSHIALVRSGSTQTIYVNGNSIATNTASGTHGYASPTFTRIGGGASGALDSYIQDLRVYKGVAKYTSDFIPASTNPDILPVTPSGISGKSELTKLPDGAGAVKFDGTADYLQIADSADFDMGTGDFTLECYVNSEDNNDYQGVFGSYDYDAALVIMQIKNDGVLRFTNGDGSIDQSGTTNLHGTGWHHIAMCRSGTTLRGFVDGKQEISTTYSSSIDWGHSDNSVVIGAVDRENYPNDYHFKGQISNLRLVKGTALYTSDFTPSKSPLTNVTNTKLLCCTSPINAKSSPVAPTVGTTANTRFNSNFESIPTTVNSLTVTNNGSVSTTSAGTNVYGFTNCADLSGSNSLSVDLGAIPQVTTIDIIFKVTGTTDNKYLFAISNIGLVRRGGSNLAWYNNDGDQTISTTPDDGQWHHLRVTPKSLYFDGVETKSTSSTPNIYVSANGYMALGAYRNDSGTIQYNGAVDIGLVRVMPGVDLGAPSSIPITTNGTLSSTETIPNDGVIYAADDVSATTFNPFNTDINTVRGQETGYPTLNPLYPNPNGNSPSDGNLKQTTTAGNGQYNATMAIPQTGSWYWEVTKEGTDSTGIIGISTPELSLPSHNANNVGAFSWYIAGPRKQTNGVDSNYGGSVAQGDVVGVAYKSDIRELRFYLNGVDQGVAFDASSIGVAEYFPAFSAGSSVNTFTFSVNFGQKPFKYGLPVGYQPLSFSTILSDTGIIDPARYMKARTWYGNGGTQQIDYGFQPDLLFGKPPKATTGGGWNWIDSVRGNKYFSTQNANAQADFTGGNGVTFNTKGVSLIDTSNGDWNLNGNPGGTYVGSGGGYVYYGFKAGGNKNTFNVDGEGFGSASDVGMNAGAQNSNAYNQSETWSTASAADAKGFDGSMAYDSGATRLTGASTYHMVLNAATSFRNVTSVRIGVGVRINGILYATTYISAVGLTVTNPPSVVTTIEILGRAAPGGVQLSYIMINGVLLVDNGVSVTNVPSIPADKCSVGTKNGFSIVQYEGNGTTNQTLAHGLSQAPDFVIIKNMSAAYSWAIWHKDLSLNGGSAHNSPEYDMLDFSTSGETDFSEDCIWDVFDHSLRIHRSGNGNWVNTDGSDYTMYSWHSVPGVQKFGKYIGNNNSDGPFIETGMRPELVIFKKISADGDPWLVYDGTRNRFNLANKRIFLNNTNQESTSDDYAIDILSNGFKIRTSDTSWNADGATFIYMAWAEAPSIALYGSQSTAR